MEFVLRAILVTAVVLSIVIAGAVAITTYQNNYKSLADRLGFRLQLQKVDKEKSEQT